MVEARCIHTLDILVGHGVSCKATLLRFDKGAGPTYTTSFVSDMMSWLDDKSRSSTPGQEPRFQPPAAVVNQTQRQGGRSSQ